MSPEIDAAMRGSSAPSLLEQAEGLDRATVMKDVVGPVLTNSLKLIYSPLLTKQEQSELGPLLRSDDTSRFFSTTFGVLDKRLQGLEREHPEVYEALGELQGNKNVFFLAFSKEAIIEGVKTGVATPLRLALQIYGLEKEIQDNSVEYWFDSIRTIDPESLAEIMERESFDDILMRLARGPNGFLRADSTNIIFPGRSIGRDFFSFVDPEAPSDDKWLKIEKAFEVKDGEVVGLSDSYHVAANERRKYLHSQSSESSSGCPVSRRFPYSYSNAKQESLIITAKKFLVTAMRQSPKQPLRYV